MRENANCILDVLNWYFSTLVKITLTLRCRQLYLKNSEPNDLTIIIICYSFSRTKCDVKLQEPNIQALILMFTPFHVSIMESRSCVVFFMDVL